MPVGTPLAEGKTPPNGPVPRADASGTPDPRDEAHFQKLQQLFEQTRTLLTELRATQNEVAKVKNEIQQAQAAINAAAVQIPQLTMQIANIAGQLNGPPMPLNIRQQMKAQGAVLEGQLGMLVQAKQNSEKQLEFALPRKLSAAEGNAGDAGRKCDKMLPQWIALSDPFGDQSRAAHLRTAELCSGWLTSEPEFIAGYLMRGFARLHVGEADGAKKDFDRVAQFGHGRTMSKNEQEVLAAALSGRSVLHAETKQEAQAKSDFGDAGDLCPKSVLVSVFRGRANALLGKTRSAIDDFLKATKLDSKEPAGFHELAWLLATTPTLNEGKRAADFGRTACELTNWNHWQCLDAYALASAANASFEEAVKWGTKALEIAPPDVRPAVEERLKLYRAGVAPANVKRR
jgi:tetratricopeptide (TPR) repeat protein